jgi:hypothetical protein
VLGAVAGDQHLAYESEAGSSAGERRKKATVEEKGSFCTFVGSWVAA